ncbi:MAG: hypothetical protein AAFV53_00290 [Myxococcota bacterium]
MTADEARLARIQAAHERIKAMREARRRRPHVKPRIPEPIYDEDYWEGIAYLDSLDAWEE